jgi:hypothetical protein
LVVALLDLQLAVFLLNLKLCEFFVEVTFEFEHHCLENFNLRSFSLAGVELK